MSFFNITLSSAEEFKDTLPDIYDLFIQQLKTKLADEKTHTDYSFHQVVGFLSPKGQCYEVTYKKTDYANYYRNTFTAYMECHTDKNGMTTLDEFSL